MRLYDTQKLVQEILFENPQARKSDRILFLEMCKRTRAMLFIDEPFEWVLMNAELVGLPNYESVGRTRRKVQELFPELKDNEVAVNRAIKEEEYIEYARSQK